MVDVIDDEDDDFDDAVVDSVVDAFVHAVVDSVVDDGACCGFFSRFEEGRDLEIESPIGSSEKEELESTENSGQSLVDEHD